MTELKQKTYYELRYFQFEEIVKAMYGHNYFFQADVEAANDTEHAYENITRVNYVLEMDKWNTDRLQKFIDTGHYSHLARVLLLAAVQGGLLPEGNYLIRIDY